MALLIFSKCGDFYETYGGNAGLAAKVLGLALNSRGGRPMASVPAYRWPDDSELLTANGYAVTIDQGATK